MCWACYSYLYRLNIEGEVSWERGEMIRSRKTEVPSIDICLWLSLLYGSQKEKFDLEYKCKAHAHISAQRYIRFGSEVQEWTQSYIFVRLESLVCFRIALQLISHLQPYREFSVCKISRHLPKILLLFTDQSVCVCLTYYVW